MFEEPDITETEREGITALLMMYEGDKMRPNDLCQFLRLLLWFKTGVVPDGCFFCYPDRSYTIDLAKCIVIRKKNEQ